MKVSKIIGSAAQGMVTTSFHTHWSDVNPIKRQSVSKEEKQEDMRKWNEERREFWRKQRALKARGSRILPALCR